MSFFLVALGAACFVGLVRGAAHFPREPRLRGPRPAQQPVGLAPARPERSGLATQGAR